MKYKDLPQQDRTSKTIKTKDGHAIILGPATFLYCESCDGRYSASRGDYFMADPEAEIICGECDEPMILAQERTEIVPV